MEASHGPLNINLTSHNLPVSYQVLLVISYPTASFTVSHSWVPNSNILTLASVLTAISVSILTFSPKVLYPYYLQRVSPSLISNRSEMGAILGTILLLERYTMTKAT